MNTLQIQHLLIVALLLVVISPARTQDRIDPKSEELVTLPELGRMVGVQGRLGYGSKIHALGDINHDNIADFCLSSYAEQVDTGIAVGGRWPEDLLVYHGVKGKLPARENHQRLGPTDPLSVTTFLACGDYDSDGNVDVVTDLSLLIDTSAGNNKGYSLSRIVVWWGNAKGEYSLADTTQLTAGTQVWGHLGVRLAIGNYRLGDGVDNLLFWTWGQGVTNGEIVKHPTMLLYRGHRGKRWGRDGVSNSYDWGWWNSPKRLERIYTIDQDCDGASDLVLAYDEYHTRVTGKLYMLYGIPGGGIPDTADLVTLDLNPVYGHNALLSDVSGDGVPELLVVSMNEIIHIYAGEPGVRLLEQFGTGNDPPDPGNGRWYRRPWAQLPLPNNLDDAFAPSGDTRLLALGDAGLNGTNDIWVICEPFIIAYSTGRHGECLDSLFDAIIFPAMSTVRYWEDYSMVLIGDVDSSGIPSIAISYDIHTEPWQSGVQFVKPSRKVFEDYCVLRDWLHDDSVRCGSTTGVTQRQGQQTMDLALQAIPNPSTGQVQVQWKAKALAGTVTITIHDVLGREVVARTAAATERSWVWNALGLAPGRYYITLTIAEYRVTTPVIIT